VWISQRQEGRILGLCSRFGDWCLSAANQEGSGHQIATNGFQQVLYFRLVSVQK
jgi:hypothetical protein